jgi:uncharacterized membrane protein
MFSIRETIKYGWNKSKENLELVLFSTLLVLALGAIVSGFQGHGPSLLFTLIGVIFSIIIRIGYTKIFLRMYDGEKPSFSDIFKEYGLFWKYLGVSILYGLTVLGGLILIIIPGIYWAVRFSFSPLIVVDTRSRIIASMKESYAITKGKFWKLLGFWIVMGLLNILGAIIFGIGLLVSVPVTLFASIYVYRTLSKARAALTPTPSPQTA